MPLMSCIAHRGASAYAPEHTAAAYQLAIEQGANYVEQDLAVTKDGVLVCVHDATLERTTDVATVFSGRAVTDPATGERHWWVVDFTLAEIKQLDAGSWFDPSFATERVPTWDEAIAIAGDRAGLYPELKLPALYRQRGIDMTRLFVEHARKVGMIDAPAERMIVQSFDSQALADVALAAPALARTFLIDGRDADRWFVPDWMSAIAGIATGIGPDKLILEGRPQLVALAHDAGLTVTPYTFTSRAPRHFADVTSEMKHYLRELGVDALFTDNPDLFPR
jgi:glycerophosphoryl diester phosphodiesterase